MIYQFLENKFRGLHGSICKKSTILNKLLVLIANFFGHTKIMEDFFIMLAFSNLSTSQFQIKSVGDHVRSLDSRGQNKSTIFDSDPVFLLFWIFNIFFLIVICLNLDDIIKVLVWSNIKRLKV